MPSSRPFTSLQLENVELIEKLHAQFLADPESIDPTWRLFFEGVEFAEYRVAKMPIAAKGDERIVGLIDAYRRFGHLEASTNPIATHAPPKVDALSLAALGFDENELQEVFPTHGLLQEEKAPLTKIIEVLRSIYCGSKGIEYMGCEAPALEKWIQEKIEPSRFSPQFSIEKKKEILHQLNKAELFEIFVHTKYVGQKRFSLEGAETLIPILSEIVEKGSENGMDEFVLGMAHRGRLNVLTNILNKSYSMVFSEFEDYLDPNLTEGAGDVKYHKGFSSDVALPSGKTVHISLTANPSHLESVDSVTLGKVRAKQAYHKDVEKKRIVPILIHGDASIAGQGIVYETLQFHGIEGYGNGGTIHLIINNQIGFTTLPSEYRSTHYCTDLAHAFGFPVFHVNAEDPEGCVFAAELAQEIRQTFHIDVFIELNGYRKYGHNESDEPAFTQPLEYQLIRSKKSIREIYRDQLIQEGVVAKEIALSLEDEFKKELHYELEEFKIKKEKIPQEAFGGVWADYRDVSKEELFADVSTAIEKSLLQDLGSRVCTIPEGLAIHPKLKRLLEQRQKMALGEAPIDWAMGEQLAFASLLWEKKPVRLSGQDSQRGTFTQRHAAWVDQATGKRYYPLSHLKEDQGVFTVYNSTLSEYGVLGFEFGYSLAYPSALVLWEAQFGDFANGGQVIFDQYLSCSEQKWRRFSGLTVLLPHGYEGQGAEHSSARIERFLQLAAEMNMQIVYPTTPAQYFHLLRRQVKRTIRLPLIVFTPKGLLRHPACISPIETFAAGSFQEILEEEKPPLDAASVIFCTGRIYYDLVNEREKRKLDRIAIIRIEQLYPLHKEKLKQIIEKYKQAKKYTWVQEEPRNMGAMTYIYPIMEELMPKKMRYVSRPASASTATGSHTKHLKEYNQLMSEVFDESRD